MRLALEIFSTLAVLVTAVAAGGYQGCLERVLSFQAYEIDGLNPAADRTLGFKCASWQNKACHNNHWIPCSGSAAGGRCNFYEFLKHMGSLPNTKDWARYQTGSTTRLDHDATAARCLYIYQNKNGAKKIVRNFPPYQAMKGAGMFWNKYVMDVASLVDGAAQHHKTGDNGYMWDDFDSTRDRIIVFRAGDHGEKLIAAAKAALGDVMDIKTNNMGPHRDPNKVLETIDWKATVLAAKSAGVPNYKKRLDDFYDEFYEKKKTNGQFTAEAQTAREYRSLNRSYKKMVDRARKCR